MAAPGRDPHVRGQTVNRSLEHTGHPRVRADRLAARESNREWRAPYRVLYVVSHPIPYQEPLLRRLSKHPRIDLTVRFLSDFSTSSHEDPGFGGTVDWQTPLATGYRHEFATHNKRPPNRLTGAFGEAFHGLTQSIRSSQFDAMWFHGYHHIANWRAAMIAKRRGLPLIVRGETAAFDQPTHRAPWKTRVLRQVAKNADALLAIGSANARFWQSHGAPADRVFFVPYAIDNAWFQARADIARDRRADFRRELGLHPHRPVILFVGKLLQRKRVDDLVRAAHAASSNLQEARRPYLIIAGDGPERQGVERLTAHTIGMDRTRFVGFQPPHALPRLYDLATALVLPSDNEPWGLVVNEAMACGTPAIVTDRVGAGPDLVRQGRTGFIGRCGDVAGLAGHIESVCADPTLADQLGRAARAHIEPFSFASDEKGLLRALDRVIP